MADVQEIQEYLWKNPIFHNYSLQVELQTQPPLLKDFGNPVSDMFGRDLRRLYALLQLKNIKIFIDYDRSGKKNKSCLFKQLCEALLLLGIVVL